MGFLDSDSEGDYSECSEDASLGDDSAGDSPPSKPRLTRNVSSTSTCSTRSVTEGSVEERLSAIMGMKLDMGMDKDPEFLRKEAKKEEIQKAQDEANEKLASMTTEERHEQKKGDVGCMMDKIRAKRELSQRNLMKKDKGEKPDKVIKNKATKEEDEMAEFRRLKLKKANSKKKLLRKKSMDSQKRVAV